MIVSFVVVAYNEESTLPRLLADLKAQDYPHNKTEVLLIDSMSTDKTFYIMQNFADSKNDFLRVSVYKNEKKVLPSGCNIALNNYTGDAIVRIDAHASIPSDFITKNVTLLQSGEAVCGGRRPNIIDDDTPFKQTLLVSEQAMFGSGISSYRNSNKKSYVRSVFHGMYRREVYDKVGPYNELLTRTEDNDMSHRIGQAGFKTCYDPDIISYQHTRNSLKEMLRQKFLNGYWIGKTIGINPKCFSLFHFVPFCFVMAIIITGILAAFGCPFLAVLLWSVYILFILANSVIEIVKRPFSFTNLFLPLLFLLLHTSYGVGTLVGIVEMPFWVRKVKK